MNPNLAFALIWALIFALHSIGVFYFYEAPSFQLFFLFFSLVLVSYLFCAFFMKKKVNQLASLLPSDNPIRIANFTTFCLLVATAILVYEIYVFEGVPLYWLIVGVEKSYADFGIPSLHGLYNALILFVLTSSFCLVLFGHRRSKYSLHVITALFFIILLANRGMLFIFFIQAAGAILIRYRHLTKFRYLLLLSPLVLVLALLFGVLGNARTSHQQMFEGVIPVVQDAQIADKPNQSDASEDLPPYITYIDRIKPEDADIEELFILKDNMWQAVPVGTNPYLGLIKYQYIAWFQYIPTEFLWVYAYSTTGLNNLLYNLDLIEPTGLPYYTFIKLVPTMIKNELSIGKEIDSFQLSHPGFTVSTAFSGSVSDFGIWGIFFIIPVLLISYIAYILALNGYISAWIIYSMLFQSIVLSPFVDTVLYGPFLAQIILTIIGTWWFNKNLFLKSNSIKAY